MGRLFGTDGVRGVANAELDCDLAFRLGQAAATVLTETTRHKPKILIGKDTRISSDMLEAALTAGVCSVGGDAVSLGVIPTQMCIRDSVKTAIMVGHGRGAILLSGAKAGLPIYEYTPLQIKQSVVGYGRADKNQVQQMVKVLLNLKEIPRPDDTADGLAVAICHAHASNSRLPYQM